MDTQAFTPPLAHHRDPLGDIARVVGGLKDPAPAGIDAPEQLGELPQGLRSEDQVHMAVGIAQLVHVVGLLSHAAAQTDDLAGLSPLGVDQGPHVAQHPLFGVLPDGAGVDDDDVGLLLPVSEGKAHGPEVAPDALGIGLVLLAAVGIHKSRRRGGPGGIHLRDTPAQFHLAGHLLGGDAGGDSVQITSSRQILIDNKLYHFSAPDTRVKAAGGRPDRKPPGDGPTALTLPAERGIMKKISSHHFPPRSEAKGEVPYI